MTDHADSIEASVIELLAHRVPADTRVTAETRIVGDLGLDSVAVLDFIQDVEDRFDLSIPLERVAEVQTIGELSAAIQTLKGAPR
ncbi:MAG TPA: acyl carrier protein [Steroidobacteraceae bacterium]|nr:acyl carrier protein [Steroidobacteraceae bacterium]